jgi:hypothetical protein
MPKEYRGDVFVEGHRLCVSGLRGGRCDRPALGGTWAEASQNECCRNGDQDQWLHGSYFPAVGLHWSRFFILRWVSPEILY